MGKILIVPPRREPPGRAGDAVVRQDLGARLALRILEEVASLHAHLHAALGHETRRDRRVVVGREIEVIGLRVFEAANAGQARRRREEPGLALVRQRKLEPRRIEDRRVEEEHRRVAAGAHLARLVDFELAHADVPVLAGRDARRVAGVGGLVAIGPREPDFRCAAARVVLADEEARRREEARFRAAPEFDLRPGDPVEAVADQHVALAPDLLGQEVVAQPIRKHGLAPGTQLDLPRRLDRCVGRAFDAVGAHEYRALVAGTRHRRRGSSRFRGGRRRPARRRQRRAC